MTGVHLHENWGALIKTHLQSWTGIGGLFLSRQGWREELPPQRDHADSSLVQWCRDYHPGPSFSAENSKVGELRRQVRENRKFVKNKGKRGQSQGLISNQWAGLLLCYKKDFCRRYLRGKICCCFHFRPNKWDCRCYVHIQENFLIYGITFFSNRKQNECLTPETSR